MRKIAVPDEGIETLFGSYDENLRNLESLFKVKIRTDGHELLVDGDPAGVDKTERVVEQFASLMREGYRFGKGEVRAASQLVAQDPSVDLRDYFLKRTLRPSTKRQVVPKSPNQRHYLDAIEKFDIVFGVGPAGTGKTYLAMAQAVSFLVAKKVTRIILARPAVEAGEKLGFLPGDLQEKVNPYLRPLYDALYDMLEAERVDRLLERGTIEVAPIAFMRGRTACAFHFQQWIGPGEAMGVLGITMLGIALPAPPGFAGVFEAAVRAALAVFGVAGEDLAARALAFALVFHWGPYLLLAIWAGFYVWRDKIGLGRLFRFARGGSEPEAA